ncbi:MAG: SDR family NAD(P)-dependent oxidoreductase, partial [Chloroflexi bacterium]|nr:SDR family NAD(P)-dependent oxidoreductase [Chloroflexota bacterium]
MLELFNRHSHGFVAIPTIIACDELGLFTELKSSSGAQSAAQLAEALQANEGHLGVALRLLHSLGWLEGKDNRYRLTLAAEGRKDIPPDVVELLALPIADYLLAADGDSKLQPWLERLKGRWGISEPLLADFVDGLILIPLLIGLERHGALSPVDDPDQPLFSPLDSKVQACLVALFEHLGWAERDGRGAQLTALGRFMAGRALNMAVIASYRPLLAQLPTLLTGDPKNLLEQRNGQGHETHLDRSLNVQGSGFQHERYFADVDEIVVEIFNRRPISGQPCYICDTGCGDGTLLRRLYELICERTARGQVLQRYPLTLIGVDYNQAALEETARTLAGLPHRVLQGDVGNPQQILADLRAQGVEDAEQILHIRSFQDHDRPYLAPVDEKGVERRLRLPYAGVYVDAEGKSIAPAVMVQSLVEHLERWRSVLGPHGLISLEVHNLHPHQIRQAVDLSESLYFDAIRGYSGQYLLEAETYLLALAEAGLFPHYEFGQRYPRHLNATRITLHWLEKRHYHVRQAYYEDLPQLLELESACWPPGMRTSAAVLQQRLERYPEGQLVVEQGGRVVAALYTQRIDSPQSLISYAQLPSLHRPRGEILQLIILNVHPKFQGQGLSDQLIEFNQQWCLLKNDICGIAGVTRCGRYSDDIGVSMADYVGRSDPQGKPLDPILRFHHSHGARIVKLLPDYRPEDQTNHGYGVLIHYDLDEIEARAVGPLMEGPETSEQAPMPIVEQSVRTILGPDQHTYESERALRDLGLDSLDIIELQALLERHFNQALDTSFFFEYSTPKAIAGYFEGETTPLAPSLSAVEPEGAPAIETSAMSNDEVNRGLEPLAIVGMACRFPGGVRTPEDFWELLYQGVDAISEVPASRWQMDRYRGKKWDSAEHAAIAYGGFIEDVEQFDPKFFRIAPREARSIDPQQRLLLELSWEALERAGINPEGLAGSNTGVFAGIFTHDYQWLQVREQRIEDYDGYFGTGTSDAVVAGRLAYFYDFHGPAVAVDTACSASLSALHLAGQSLRSGECELALVVAANLLLSPELSLTFSKAGMLAADGRCKTFDAAADGYVRGEGAGVVVLKRLSQARADGDEILALVRGSAMNHDGSSNGLTAPSGPAQEGVIREALKVAGVNAAEVSYVEAHGTGTSLGDPIEVKALSAVYGQERASDNPLLLGSVKTNIGHTEAAAGLAGLIKVVLALQHRHIPPHLHFQQPNPELDLAAIPARIPTKGEAWQENGRNGRVAGLSSFGFSGTNLHVLLASAPEPVQRAKPVTGPQVEHSHQVLALSAKSEAALSALAGRYRSYLEQEQGEIQLADMCYTAAVGRSHFGHRAALVGSSAQALGVQLEALQQGRAVAGLYSAQVGTKPKTAWLFTGQGSQYAGMGQQLYETQPSFRSTLNRCAEILDEHIEISLLEVLFGANNGGALGLLLDHDEAEAWLKWTANTQPAFFALEYALAKLWQSWGIQPDVVMGHSVGEYVAACLAGVFSLEHALELIATRGRLMQALPSGGVMLAVMAPAERVQAFVADHSDVISIAGINGPKNTVISGEGSAVKVIAERLQEHGIHSHTLKVSHAFHSPLMQPMLAEFERVASQMDYHKPQLPIISNVTGRRAGAEIATPEYWVKHVMSPVHFAQGMATLAKENVIAFLEVGPQPLLLNMGQQCLPEHEGLWLPSLRRGQLDWQQMLSTLAQLYVSGVEVDWSGFDQDYSRRKVPLPTYPFQRRPYWIPLAPEGIDETDLSQKYTLLGRRQELAPSGDILYTQRINEQQYPWIADHRVYETTIVPGATYMVMALQATDEAVFVRDVIFQEPLILNKNNEDYELQFLLSSKANSHQQFRVYGRTVDANGEWNLHAQGSLEAANKQYHIKQIDIDALKHVLSRQDQTSLNAQWKRLNLDYGPCFQTMPQVWSGERKVLGEIIVPEVLSPHLASEAIHPALLDACIRLGLNTIGDGVDNDVFWAPWQVEGLTLNRDAPSHFYAYLDKAPRWEETNQTYSYDIELYDESGQWFGEIQALTLKRAPREIMLRHIEDDVSRLFYKKHWQHVPISVGQNGQKPSVKQDTGLWLIVGENHVQAQNLATNLWGSKGNFLLVAQDKTFVRLDDGKFHLSLSESKHWSDLFQSLNGERFTGVIWALPPSTHDEDDPLVAAKPHCGGLLALVQALLLHKKEHLPGGLQILTVRAQAVEPGEPVDPVQRMMWGLGRAIQSEAPGLQTRLIDLGVGIEAMDAVRQAIRGQAIESETQCACRDGRWYVPRLASDKKSDSLNSLQKNSWQLTSSECGDLANLVWKPHELSAPNEDEVQVDVRAAGLNFRDVLNALGEYPGDPGALGGEVSGEVVAVGAGVTDLQVGDRLFGLCFGRGGFVSRLNIDAMMMKRLPEGVSYNAGATLAVAYCTALAAFQLAGLKPGERVLIHAASGGVGLAAVHLCRSMGAEIYATASRLKQSYLKQLGITHIYDSRSTEFSRQILADTHGAGVDVVLNSLTGEGFIEASLASLAESGRFVEIGKRAILTTAQMQLMRPDVSYYLFALDELMKQKPQEVSELLQTVADCVERGEVPHLRHRIYPMVEAELAFRTMQRAHHIGKLVLKPPTEVLIRSDASYLITGGLGALGVETAKWLVEQGAGRIILNSRHLPDQDTIDTLEELRIGGGTSIDVISADIANKHDVQRLMQAADEDTKRPLRGVIHAAGTLDDGVLGQQNWERFTGVMKPKVLGAYHLHNATRNMALDFFVMYSSVASLLGLAGQSNYAAANSYLDGLSHDRHAKGLPALSIQWGPWAGEGMATRNRSVQRRLQHQGLQHMEADTAHKALARLLRLGHTHAAVVDGDWEQVTKTLGKARQPFLDRLLEQREYTAEIAPLLEQLNRTQDAAKHRLITNHIQHQIQQILSLPT